MSNLERPFSSTPSAVPSPLESQRVLCLQIQKWRTAKKTPVKAIDNLREHENFETSLKAIAEAFLRISPRVQVREPNLVFIEISSTSHLLGGEPATLALALQIADLLGLEINAAISDTAYGAQLFSEKHPFWICPRFEEKLEIGKTPIQSLQFCEGLEPWQKKESLKEVLLFLQTVGIKTIAEIQAFSPTALQERWDQLGRTIWRRIHGLDLQVIAPLQPTEALTGYQHFDEPISLVSLILHKIEITLRSLFARLQGRRIFAQRIQYILYCEYSDHKHTFSVQPQASSRDIEIFLKLTEMKLDKLELENPIRMFEIEIVSTLEKNEQYDFFEPRSKEEDRLQNLMSTLKQANVECGLYEMQESFLPEKTWTLVSIDSKKKRTKKTEHHKHSLASAQTEIDEAFNTKSMPMYSAGLSRAPRPNRISFSPIPLSSEYLQSLKRITQFPIESTRAEWWKTNSERDYYFALTKEQRGLWIFKDREQDRFYLHGYFD